MIMQQCLIAVIIYLMLIIVVLLIMTIPATDYGELGLVLHNFGGMLTSIKIQIYDRQQKENTNKKRVKWAGSDSEQN
jgi:hypothetical protein